MARGTERLVKKVKRFIDSKYRILDRKYGQQVLDLLDLPFTILFAPITLAYDFAGSAQRGFGVPELISKLSFTAIFAVAYLGTYDIALELGKKVICQRNCGTCNGWNALRCTTCKGSGHVHYQVKNPSLKRGEKATADSIADAIVDNRAELVHLPSAIDLHVPLPSKDCPSCEGTGVMKCPECQHKLQVRISADDIMEPPWTAYNIMKKMDYPYEHIVDSMKDPSIAAFWLLTMPQMVGGFTFKDDVKQKIWWQYKESMRYDQIRDVVAKRKVGWEDLQEALISLDPIRAKDDPVIVKNVPYYKAKKALEAEVLKLDPPPRPENWGDLDLPLNSSSWSEEDQKDPKKLYEMTVLLNAQRELADKILDTQWESKWRQDKLKEMLEEKVRAYVQNVEKSVLTKPIVMQQTNEEQKKKRQRRWWIF
uniref:AtTam37 zinc finger domain-containing protein n=1 Tax=Kalanchoe fedtschenkoi TaxID=63787 RepID=A0A7N0SV30_KALFE